MMKKIFEFFYALITVLGISFAFWYFEKDDTINVTTFFIWLFPMMFTILFLLQNIIIMVKIDRKVLLPKLKAIQSERLIFDNSDLFSYDTLVSLYLVEEIEEFIGYGYVEIITQKNKLQISILGLKDGITEEDLKRNKNRIILKPSIPHEIYKVIKEEGD